MANGPSELAFQVSGPSGVKPKSCEPWGPDVVMRAWPSSSKSRAVTPIAGQA